MELRILLVLAGGATALWAFSRWRLAVQVVLVLLVLEGAIRKWLLPGAQDIVYFGKDVLLLAAYLGFWTRRKRLRERSPLAPALWLALGLGAAFGLFQAFNPRLPSVLVGLLGFKAYFWYAPLLFVVPAVFHSDEALFRFLRRYVLLAVPVGLLAVAQFLSSSSSLLNTYARVPDASYISSFGTSTHVRVTATFSYISGYSAYLLTMGFLLLALLAILRWRWRGQLPLYAALAMTLLGMLMTGSRGPVFMLALLFPIYWLLAIVRERGSAAVMGRQVLALGLLAVAIGWVAPEAVGAFRGRAAGRGDLRGRAMAPVIAPLRMAGPAGPLGFGIGATHQAATAVVKHLPPHSWVHGATEAETGRVMLELGPLGFVLVYFVRLYLVLFALAQALRLRTRFHRALATAAFLIFLAQLPGSVVFDPTMGVYYWFMGGLLMTAMRLDDMAFAVGHRAATVLPPTIARAAAAAMGEASSRQLTPTPSGLRRKPAWQRL